MTFSLVAYLILSGEIHAFKLDSNLTYDDCQAAIASGMHNAEIVPGISADLSRAPLVCQIESAPDVVVAASGEE